MSPPRRRTLLIVAACLVGASLLCLAVKALILDPGADLDNQAAQLEANIRQAERALAAEPNVARRLSDLYRRTFGTDEGDVSEEMRARLMSLLAPSGLNTEQISSSPGGAPTRLRGSRSNDREVSRNVNIKGGKLSHTINLLYLLAAESHLHRIDSLTLKPNGVEKGKVDLQFRYSTLAMEPPKGQRPATSPATTQLASLDVPEREIYRLIEERDLFRPYVKRPPPEPSAPPQVAAPSAPLPPPPPPPPGEPEEAKWRLAGLPTLFGTELVYFRHRGGESRSFKVGQDISLLDGKIVLVDCRAVRRHDNPKIFSESRVIVQVKDTYWAVELGDRLIDKHRLSAADLPSALKAPATQPAAAAPPREVGKS
jgi:hypothetical protein